MFRKVQGSLGRFVFYPTRTGICSHIFKNPFNCAGKLGRHSMFKGYSMFVHFYMGLSRNSIFANYFEALSFNPRKCVIQLPALTDFLLNLTTDYPIYDNRLHPLVFSLSNLGARAARENARDKACSIFHMGQAR